jgi:cation/acetate symporter
MMACQRCAAAAKLDQVVTELGFASYTGSPCQHAEHGSLHPVADDRYRGSAARDHALLHGAEGGRRALVRRLGAGLHRAAVPDAPAVGAMARLNITEMMWPNGGINGGAVAVEQIENDSKYDWMSTWQKTGLLDWEDKNGDGKIQYYNDKNADLQAVAAEKGWEGNELTKFNRDILVLANPEIANLPSWVIGLVAAGGLAAALSTAAGLLLAISSAVSHDLIKGAYNPNISEKGELLSARIAMAVAIVVATYLGLNPPGFAAQTVALAFGLAAASIFPALMMGIFTKVNNRGAVAGMIAGI